MIGLQKWAALSCIISNRLSPSLHLPYLPVLYAEKVLQSNIPNTGSMWLYSIYKMWLYSISERVLVVLKSDIPANSLSWLWISEIKEPSHREGLLYSPYAIRLRTERWRARRVTQKSNWITSLKPHSITATHKGTYVCCPEGLFISAVRQLGCS